MSHAAHDHDHAHPAHLQHPFETPAQQFDSGKLGIWLFLATEILMFGWLFVAYAVYRANHPEIFLYAIATWTRPSAGSTPSSSCARR